MELATRIRRSITAIPSNANGSPPMASQQYVHRVPTVYADIWTKVNGPPIQVSCFPLNKYAYLFLSISLPLHNRLFARTSPLFLAVCRSFSRYCGS
jgi:hypothetical protein